MLQYIKNRTSKPINEKYEGSQDWMVVGKGLCLFGYGFAFVSWPTTQVQMSPTVNYFPKQNNYMSKSGYTILKHCHRAKISTKQMSLLAAILYNKQ